MYFESIIYKFVVCLGVVGNSPQILRYLAPNVMKAIAQIAVLDR